MIKRSHCILALLLAFWLIPGTMRAAEPLPASQCVSQIQNRMAQQQRLYRDVLFGRHAAHDEAVGATRYDEDGTAWLKTSENTWRTAAQALDAVTRSDTQMDQRTEWEEMNSSTNPALRSARPGIFETKGVLTSELIPAITQSYRALNCRAAMVCASVRASILQKGPARLVITTPGCAPLVTPPMEKCQASVDSNTLTADAFADAIIRTQCEPLMQELLQKEASMLTLAVSYDAAYRSLLQFAGNFDAFLGEFRGDLLTPIEQAMGLLSQVSRIPCFLSQCSE